MAFESGVAPFCSVFVLDMPLLCAYIPNCVFKQNPSGSHGEEAMPRARISGQPFDARVDPQTAGKGACLTRRRDDGSEINAPSMGIFSVYQFPVAAFARTAPHLVPFILRQRVQDQSS